MTTYQSLKRHMGHQLYVEVRTGTGEAVVVCSTCKEDVLSVRGGQGESMDSYQDMVLHLRVLTSTGRIILRVARSEELDWQEKYDVIFSPAGSRAFWQTMDELGWDADYYCPDTSYEDDVNAFAAFVDEMVKRAQVVLTVLQDQTGD